MCFRLAGWFYTQGETLVEQVWKETIKELKFAGVEDIISTL